MTTVVSPELKKLYTILEQVDNCTDIIIELGASDYAIGKKKLVICIDDSLIDPNIMYYTDKDEQWIKDNYIVYKLLHIYAYTLCSSLGMTDEWREKFISLLQKAIEKGLYVPPSSTFLETCWKR